MDLVLKHSRISKMDLILKENAKSINVTIPIPIICAMYLFNQNTDLVNGMWLVTLLRHIRHFQK